MSTDQVSLFFALLALLAEIAAVGLVAALLVHAVRPTTPWPADLLDAVRSVALVVAAGVAIVSTLGSLYYSEVAHFPPCRLCWFQRIGMYPLAVILPIAAFRRDVAVRWYALPLAVAGGLVSVYHVLVERYPSLESGSCDPTNPCSIIWVERLGYLTIPTMALSGFALIAVLLFLAKETS
ncbi:MAG TPA: disulfide bond formation protein B [Acidimicrobiales bacterium]|nr:disulfide bond formation protein B [Acidimicrobiales bacterium]